MLVLRVGRGCKVIGCWRCFDTVVNSSLVSTASGLNVWKNQSFGITPNKSTVPFDRKIYDELKGL